MPEDHKSVNPGNDNSNNSGKDINKKESTEEKASKERAKHAENVKKEAKKSFSKDKRRNFKAKVENQKENLNPFTGKVDSQPRPQPQPQQPEPQPQPQPEVNPFTGQSSQPPVNPFADSKLPTNQYEEEQKEQVERIEQEKPNVQADWQSESVPEAQNPFAPQPQSGNTADVKAFEDRSFEKRDNSDNVARNPFEVDKNDEPESTGESREQAGGSGENAVFGGSEEKVEKKEEVQDETPSEKPTEAPAEVVEVTESEVKQVDPQLNDQEANQVERDVFQEDFWEVLEQAGLTKKRIAIFFGIFVFIIAGLIVFFSFDFGDSADSGDDSPDKSVEEQPKMEGSGVDDSDAAFDDGQGAVQTGYIVGSEFRKFETQPIGQWGNTEAIEAAFNIGRASGVTDSAEFIRYVELLRRMQNIYNTDIYDLLDQSDDRSEALDAYIAEMEAIIAEGENVYEEINERMVDLDTRYAPIIDNKTQNELAFFEAIKNLEGENSYNYLDNFVSYSQTGIDMKARYNGYKSIREMLANSVNALRPRFEDVVANREALIRGVKVFDIPGSDINAIIRLEN